jgi:hypothetical protein
MKYVSKEAKLDHSQRYEVYHPDGNSIGYFLDGRLYEYRTATCIGFLNDAGFLVDEDRPLGRLEGDRLTLEDGITYHLK